MKIPVDAGDDDSGCFAEDDDSGCFAGDDDSGCFPLPLPSCSFHISFVVMQIILKGTIPLCFATIQ
jgi:hypothetical protein